MLAKSKLTRIMSFVIAFLVLVAMMPQIGQKAHAASAGKLSGPEVLKSGVNTADAKLVKMGDRYWYVIGYDSTGVAAGSGEVSFLSKDNIKLTPFDKGYDIVYNTSNLKKDIEAYVNEKLSAGEKSAIAARDLSAVTIKENENVNWWESNYQTVDSVVNVAVKGALLWPLSAKEAVAVNTNIRKTGGDYWLRSLGVPEDEEYVWYGLDDFDVYTILPGMAIVNADGNVAIQDDNTSYWKGMRPAFKMNKSDIVMVSDATGGKDSAEDGTLTGAGAVTAKNLKLTAKDDAHKNFYVNPCDVEFGDAGSLKVKYSSAVTGEKEYISAIIKGADGSIKQYGRVAKVTESSGTATIKGLPTDASGKASLPAGDKLYVFNEQYNGDEKTDLASGLTEIRFTGHNWVFDNIKYDTRTGDVTAEYHCSIDGNHFTTASGDYGTERTAPTCEEPGKEYEVLSISADKSPDGKAHKKSNYRTDYAPKLGHNYNHFFGFRWTGDASSGYKKAEAIFACDHDYSHVTYVEAVVTSKVQEPTCEGIGRTLYQATLSADKSLDGNEHGAAKYAKATKKLGHDWGEPTYTWASDSSVTATRVCKRDSSHVETETVETEKTITKAPTCKEEGMASLVKTKPFRNDAFKEQSKTNVTLPVDPEAHVWDEGEKQGDINTCGGQAMIYKCTLCDEGEKTVVIGGNAHDWTDYIVDVEPTCTEMGEKSQHCTKCDAHDLDGIETIDPTGHKWKFDGFTWTGNETDGYGMAVANYVCENDPSHKMTANTEINAEVIEPTCQEGGKTVYTATVSKSDSPDEAEHSDSKDADATEKVSHEMEYSGIKWTGNETDGYTKAVAEYKCKFGCGETQEVEASIAEESTDPDCENGGKITYTAIVKAEDSITGEEHKETKVVKTADALGHDWDFKDVIWTGDEENGFTKAEVKFVCENDESHVKLVKAKITEEVIDPTCLEEGYTMYTALLEPKDSLDGMEIGDFNFAKIKEPIGHAWDFKDFTWIENEEHGYSAKANYVCKHDGSHVVSTVADIHIDSKAATCEEPGSTLYTAIVSKDKSLTGAEVKEEKSVKGADPIGHKWDAGKVTKAATCTEKGVKTYTCTACKATKNEDIVATGHKYGAWTKLDAKQHQRVCEHDKNHVEKSNHSWDAGKVTRKATKEKAGIKTYTCTVCKAAKTETIPKLKPKKKASTVKPVLVAKGIAKGKKAVNISWNKVSGAAKYEIYFSKCNYKGKKFTMKKIKTVNGKTLKWTKKGLSKNIAYKFYVKALKKSGKKYKMVAKSKVGHFYASNFRGKHTNPKSLKLKKSKITLKKGKSATIKGTVTKVKKNKKLATSHAAKLRFTSNNKAVATVNAKGKVTAKAKGTATIYVQTINGIWKTCKITVK